MLDYVKGGFMYVMMMIEKVCVVGKVVLVDLKGDDWVCYCGVLLIMLNCVELCEVVG